MTPSRILPDQTTCSVMGVRASATRTKTSRTMDCKPSGMKSKTLCPALASLGRPRNRAMFLFMARTVPSTLNSPTESSVALIMACRKCSLVRSRSSMRLRSEMSRVVPM